MDETKGYTSDIALKKAEIRKACLGLRSRIPDRAQKESAAAEKLLGLVGGNVMIYLSIGSELDTIRIVNVLFDRNYVTVSAPYTKDGHITPRRLLSVGKPDRFGNIDENSYGPVCGNIDICVTPLVAMSPTGYRIGYGKGCYDRFFVGFDGIKIGLCFDEQIVEFAHEKHDIALDCCVTPTKVIYF